MMIDDDMECEDDTEDGVSVDDVARQYFGRLWRIASLEDKILTEKRKAFEEYLERINKETPDEPTP